MSKVAEPAWDSELERIRLWKKVWLISSFRIWRVRGERRRAAKAAQL